ncbi:hypothetical protein ACFX2B_040845 [Malus domestica]
MFGLVCGGVVDRARRPAFCDAVADGGCRPRFRESVIATRLITLRSLEDDEFVLVIRIGVVALLVVAGFSLHQILVPDGGEAELSVERHALHSAIQEAEPNVQNPLRAIGGAIELDRHGPHFRLVNANCSPPPLR